MKIKQVIITLFIILMVMFLTSWLFPKEGVYVGGIHIEIPSIEEMFFEQKVEYADIDNIVKNIESSINDTTKVSNDTEARVYKDDIVYIEYPDDDESLLYDFFDDLEKSNKKTVRVLHYGDSQIEGDRITSYIREKLQSKFDGKGQGQIPIFSRSNIANTTYQYSKGWKHNQIISPTKGFHSYGLMMETSVTEVDVFQKPYMQFDFLKPLNSTLKLYCTALGNEANINISANGELLAQKTITAEKINKINIGKVENLKNLKIETSDSVLFYSLDVSENNGVYVDNISLRGSSGWGFTNASAQILTEMAKESNLNVKLIIMQFGVNAIPQEENKVLPNYDFFKKEYSKQLAFLRKAIPDATIIVIGSSDRSIKKGTSYITNPNVPKLIIAQRQAAKENGCMFWDLFSAMGGENSMPSWVLRDKPLANTDFIHFNHRGAEYVAELLYKALQEEYLEYKRTRKK